MPSPSRLTPASMGWQKGFVEATSILLEAIMNVDLTATSDNAGDVIGDMNSRRGRIVGMEPAGRPRQCGRRSRWPRC